jgi:hypothetical protein
MAFEQTQVRLRLIPKTFLFRAPDGDDVKGQHILDALSKKKQWQTDAEGKFISVLFDGRAFKFYQSGNTITVGKTVADALRRSGQVIVGHGLNGPSCPFLEVVEQFEMGHDRPRFACPICNEDQGTAPRLARHLDKERKKNPAAFEDTVEEPAEESVAAPTGNVDEEDEL